MKRAHLIISGLVQGVAFRASTRKMAEALSLTGWVRNLADGRVEAVFEGKDSAVDQAVEWCRKGPRGAIVNNLINIDKPYMGEFEAFRIVY